MFKKTLALAILGLVSLSGSVMADYIPYGSAGSGTTVGTANPFTYTFTAAGDGDITAYFYGSSAGYGSVVGLSINGAAPTVYGLQDNSTSYGTTFTMGSVHAGDTLEFVLAIDKNNSLAPTSAEALAGSDANGPLSYLNSTASKNAGGENHVYSTAFSGAGSIPAGTYVAFEDISPLASGDRDYNDHQFVFTGVTASAPEGGVTIAMLGMACASLGLLRRKF